jgi:uncharacterized protein (UPF0332 family)
MTQKFPDSLKAMARAEEAIAAAELDINGGHYLAAANRAYYGCYYCMVALLLTKKVSAKTHQGIRAKFSELFIKTGIFPEGMAIHIKNAFDLRQEADYDLDANISLEEVKKLLDNIKEVYFAAGTYLQSIS